MENIKPQLTQLYAWWDGAFTDAEIDSIVEIGLRRSLDESILDRNNQENAAIRRSTNAWLYPDAETQWLYNKIQSIGNELNAKMFKYDINLIEPFQFAQYDAGRNEFYGKHLDTTFGRMSQAASRKLSITLQLTDGDSYEGGELRLYQGDEPTIAPKKKGMLVLFPSFIMHEVTPVTQGTRHSLVTWCHGPLFK